MSNITREQTLSIQRRLDVAGYEPGPIDGVWGDQTRDALDRALATIQPVAAQAAGLTASDYARAAQAIGVTPAHIYALVEVEGGAGWFTDVRAEILALDGPGGFIDGRLPKILFEAHWFSRFTEGRFDQSHPNVSSPKWNRALYVGGQGEWRRLHNAMELDRTAALQSASWGIGQIMGFNHLKAGYSTVEQFVQAMKRSEAEQLMAMVTFVKNSGLADELARISTDGRPFARAYNGSGYAENEYHTKLEAAYRRHANRG